MWAALHRVFALTLKELLAVLKDPRGRSTLFGPPMLQCLIFGYAATYDLNNVPFAVLDQDHSAASTNLVSRLDGSPAFERVANLSHEDQIRTAIDRREALVVLQIAQDFERKLRAGQPAELQVIADGRNSNTAGTALSYINTIVGDFNADWRQQQGTGGAAIRFDTRAWYNPNLITRWQMLPALIGTLTMLQTLLLTAMSVAREREEGTFDQLLVTPFRPVEIMAGKALPSFLIGLGQATLILSVAQLWFRIPFSGSLITLYSGLSFFLLAAVGIGLLVSSMVATMQQALLFSFVILMPFTLLSGLATPLSAMPVPLQYVTLLNPLRYAIEIAHRVYLEGATLDQLTGELWPLAAIGTVTLSAASWLFRHRLT
ncbi:MAG: ABC transporter permease [Pirellulales bacterium]